MRRRPRSTLEGLTLVEVAIVVSLVGVVLAVFVPTFFREIRTSKIAEASEQLAHLERLAAAYYAESHRVDERNVRSCIPEAAGPAPAEATEALVELDFTAEDAPGSATWTALGFDPGQTRFRYTFLPERTGCGIRDRGLAVTLRAEGDLDGDGTLSRYERRLSIRADGTLGPTGPLLVEDRVE
jgi:type II secretory pathway pseudopilin PulG